MEYREDLEYFYEDGYGYSINYEQACTPLKHIIENFGLGKQFKGKTITPFYNSVFFVYLPDKQYKSLRFLDQKGSFILPILELY